MFNEFSVNLLFLANCNCFNDINNSSKKFQTIKFSLIKLVIVIKLEIVIKLVIVIKLAILQ